MKKYSIITAVLMMGCATEPQLSAQEELIVSTLSGSVEIFNEEVLGSEENAPAADRPGLFQECETDMFFSDLFEAYDADSSLILETAEAEDVHERRAARGAHQSKKLRKLMDLLIWVYDLDADGVFSESEQQDLFADFSERCERLQEKLLEEFDLDQDGTLSEEELAQIEDKKQKKHEHFEGEKGEKECKKKDKSELKQEEERELPPFALPYDEDKNGELSEEV